jgi:hypothetical protein
MVICHGLFPAVSNSCFFLEVSAMAIQTLSQILISSINCTLYKKERRPKAPPFDLVCLIRSACLATTTHDAEANQS